MFQLKLICKGFNEFVLNKLYTKQNESQLK